MMSSIEKRQIRISAPFTKVETLASSHPFTCQVDVIFPARCSELEDVLTRLRLTNAKGRVDLARVYDAGPEFQRQGSGSSVLALSLGRDNQSRDVWCIDTRGDLTACVDKETYEKLGVVGRKLGFKRWNDERYVISLPLWTRGDEGTATATATRSRVRRSLESWDTEFVSGVGPSVLRQQGRVSSAGGAWNVVYCSTDSDFNHDDTLERWTSQIPVIDPTIHKVECEKTHLKNVWIPDASSLSSIPPKSNHGQKKTDESEDWENDVSALYEWIGMAGLHAERLFVNDRVDPFIAVYEPPADSRVGDIVHLRWTGLLPPKFIQSMIDTTSTYLRKQPAKQSTQPSSDDNDDGDGMFVAIVVHGVTNSPVVYSPPTLSSETRSTSEPPAHLPRKDGEDTWCLIMMRPTSMGNAGVVRCILVESVGQWDARWG